MTARLAVVRRSKEPLAAEVLEKALRGVPGLTAYDRKSIGGDGSGIMGRGLTAPQADALLAGLKAEGIAAEVIDDSRIPVLPAGRVVQSLEFKPESLMVPDAIGRMSPVNWQQVKLIAAGSVHVATFARSRQERTEIKTGSLLIGGLVGVPIPTRETKVEYSGSESADWRLRAEILLADDATHFTVEAEKFRFNCLGDRVTHDLAGNFCLLMSELAKRAPQARLNRGATAILGNPPAFVYYPDKTAFHEEIVWMRWLEAESAGR